MTFSYPIIFERAKATDLPPDFYYAHEPALGLTTRGEGVEPAGTFRSILKQAGLTEDEFRRL